MKLSIASDAISADFETAVLLGLEWGIEHFELKRIHHKRIPDVSPDEVAIVERVLKAHCVQLSTLSPGLFKIPLDRDLIEREVNDKFERCITLAEQLGTRSLVVFGFDRDQERTEEQAVRQIVDVLGRVARRAEQVGLKLFLENDRGLWAETPATLRAILGAVASPALRLNWDPCNLIGVMPDGPYPDGYRTVSEFVGHMHLKDASVGPDGRAVHAMMGSGDVDWVGQFESLMRENYSGFCVIEPHFGSRVSSSRSHILETRRLIRIAAARVRGEQP